MSDEIAQAAARRCNTGCANCPWRSDTRLHSLYVVRSDCAGLSKIGVSCRPTTRLQQHRKRYSDAAIKAVWEIGCNGLVWEAEKMALSAMPAGRRVHGDWFAIPDARVVELVRKALSL